MSGMVLAMVKAAAAFVTEVRAGCQLGRHPVGVPGEIAAGDAMLMALPARGMGGTSKAAPAIPQPWPRYDQCCSQLPTLIKGWECKCSETLAGALSRWCSSAIASGTLVAERGGSGESGIAVAAGSAGATAGCLTRSVATGEDPCASDEATTAHAAAIRARTTMRTATKSETNRPDAEGPRTR